MRKFFPKVLFFSLAAFLVFTLVTRQIFAASPVIVSPSNMQGWAINTSLPAVGQFVSGPDAVPSGSGSLRLFSNGDGNSVVEVNTKNHKDVLLSDISTLEYYTYGQLGTVTYPKLILNVSTNYGVDSLTFIPAFQSQVPEPGVWQSWNAKNGTWRSRFPGFATDYPAQTFSDYVAFAPNATIVNAEDGSGGLLFKASSSDSADVFDVSVDKFTIGFSSVDTIWDFEPDVVVPTNNLSGNLYSDATFTTVAAPAPVFNTNFMRNDWGLGSPASGVPVDNFSARWEGTFNFENVRYRFATTSDNKAKIYLDGNLVLDQTSRGTGQGLAEVTAGIHTVRMEYIHGTGASFFWANFWKADVCYDMNGDNRINSTDQLVIAKHFNATPTVVTPWDLNYDTKVNSSDMLMLAQKFNKTCPFI